MSLAVSQNALSTSAEKIVDAHNGMRRVIVKNHDAAIAVYVGADSGVTSANGYQLKTNESVTLENVTGELWAIAASGTPSIGIIEQRL